MAFSLQKQAAVQRPATAARSVNPVPKAAAECGRVRDTARFLLVGTAAPLAVTAPAAAEELLESSVASTAELATAAQTNLAPVVSSVAASLGELSLDSPLVIGAGLVVVGVGGLVAALAGAGSNSKVASTSAAAAFEALCAEPRTVLLDVRSKAEVKEQGIPDLKQAKKKVLSLTFLKADDEGNESADPNFVESFSKLPAVKEDSIVVILDSVGGIAPEAARALAAAGVVTEKIFYVKDGFEGPKGWKASDQPWKEQRGFELPTLSLPQLNLSGIQFPTTVEGAFTGSADALDKLAENYKKNPSLATAALAAVGIIGGAGFLIAEFEELLQLVGSLAAARFLLGNLLFANDREATLLKMKAFMKEKLGVGLRDDFKKLAESIVNAPNADAAVAALKTQVAEAEAEATPAAAPATPAVESKPAATPQPVATAQKPPAPAAPTPDVIPSPAAVSAAAAPEPAAMPSSSIPANVVEARAWIAAWRNKLATSTSAESSVGVPVNVTEARAWIAGWRSKLASSTVVGDVPANVAEARAWIDAWRKQQQQADLAEFDAAVQKLQEAEKVPVADGYSRIAAKQQSQS